MADSPADKIVIEPLSAEDGGDFLAAAPDLAGCFSDGATPHEALSNIQDAMVQWIYEAKALGRAIPAPTMAAAKNCLKRQPRVTVVASSDKAITLLCHFR